MTAKTTGRALRGRFAGLLLVLVIISIAASIFGQGKIHDLIAAAGFATLLLFAIRHGSRGFRVAVIVVAAPAAIGQLTLHLEGVPIPRALVFGFTTAFLALLTTVVVFTVVRGDIMSTDTLIGGICAYFLLGITWGTAYALVELLSPGSFAVASSLAAAGNWGVPTHPITPLLEYYSFVTLTTVGYGDMSPLSEGARVLSVAEVLVGQLYLAVLIGRLVGSQIAQAK